MGGIPQGDDPEPDPGSLVVLGCPSWKICRRMSINPPPCSGEGCGACGAARPDPLRIRPETINPTITGSSFFRMAYVTPERF